MSNAIAATLDWLKAPFNEQMDALHIVLLVGLVVVAAGLWSRVISHIDVLVGESGVL